MSTLVDEIRRRACSPSPPPAPVVKKKRKIRIVMDEPAPAPVVKKKRKIRLVMDEPEPSPVKEDYTDAMESLGHLIWRRIDGGDVPERDVRTERNADGDKITISEVRLPNATLQSYLEDSLKPLINRSVRGRLGWRIMINPSNIIFYRPSYLELKDIGRTLMNVRESMSKPDVD